MIFSYNTPPLFGLYNYIWIYGFHKKGKGRKTNPALVHQSTFSIEMINPNYITHLDNAVRIIIVWSEC